MLESYLNGEKYSKDICGNLAQQLSEVIKARIRELGFRSVTRDREIESKRGERTRVRKIKVETNRKRKRKEREKKERERRRDR